MSYYCCACNNERSGEDDGISFHRFPLKKPELLAKWVEAMKKEDFIPNKGHVLCSQHFKKEDIVPCQSVRRLKENVVPSIFAHSPAIEKPPTPMTDPASNIPLLCTNVILLIPNVDPANTFQTLPSLLKPNEPILTPMFNGTLPNSMESAPMITSFCSLPQNTVQIKEEKVDPVPEGEKKTYEELERENESLRALVQSQEEEISKLEALCKEYLKNIQT